MNKGIQRACKQIGSKFPAQPSKVKSYTTVHFIQTQKGLKQLAQSIKQLKRPESPNGLSGFHFIDLSISSTDLQLENSLYCSVAFTWKFRRNETQKLQLPQW